MISVYCPQSGRSNEEKEMFYDELIAELQKHVENCIVMGDFNRHVGSSIDEYESYMVGLDGDKVTEKESVLEFADSNGMIGGNTYFQKDDEKLITSLEEMQLHCTIFCLKRKC